MGVAVTFVMALASMVTWAVDHYILTPLDLGYMQTAAFILIIAAIVQVVEMFLKRAYPPCTRPWAFTCPSSPPTAPCWAWRC